MHSSPAGKESPVTFKRFALNARVLSDLKRRSSIGIGFYIALAFIAVMNEGYYGRNREFSQIFLALVTGICLIRMVHMRCFTLIDRINTKLNQHVFSYTVIATALIWGVGFALFMIQPDESNTKLLMAICTAGMTSGGVVAFLPERRLAIAFNISMTYPAWISMAFLGINLSLAVMILMFSCYMIIITHRGNAEYWDGLEAETRLQEQTLVLQQLSQTDPLTGLHNRRYFDTIMELEWKRSCRNHLPITVLMGDIDHFKRINDTYGHVAGDAYLVKAAEALRHVFKRDTDTVARYGGEEFVILIPGGDAEKIAMMAETVRHRIERLFVEHEEVLMSTTISFGMASGVAVVQDSPYSLISRADKALYRAKEKGRNRVETYVKDGSRHSS